MGCQKHIINKFFIAALSTFLFVSCGGDEGQTFDDVGYQEDAGDLPDAAEDANDDDLADTYGGKDAQSDDDDNDAGEGDDDVKPPDGDDDFESCPPEGCQTGEACQQGIRECAEGLFCMNEGICSSFCAKPEHCPAEFVCRLSPKQGAFICLKDEGYKSAGARCQMPQECESGLCLEGFCEAVCNSVSDCGAGEICKTRLIEEGSLAPAYAPLCAPASDDRLAVHRISLGSYPTKVGDIIGPFSIYAPPDALSLLLEADTPNGKGVEFDRIIAPDGKTIFERSNYIHIDRSRLHIIIEVPPSVAMISNIPSVPLIAGRYLVYLRHYTPGDTEISLSAYIKTTRDPAFTGDFIRLNNFFADILPHEDYEPPTPENAAEHPFFKKAWAFMSGFFKRYKIEAEFNYFSTAGSGIEEVRTTEGIESDFRRLITQPEAKAAPLGVNIFHVRSLRSDAPNLEGFELNGFDGLIPGPFRVGTYNSGIAMNVRNYDWATTDFYGTVAIHELMHYLGLFHTTEADGSMHDPIEDTPECPRTADKNNDGLLYPSECIDYDGSQLMFWATVNGTKSFLTAGQVEVIKTHPIIGTRDTYE